VNANAVVGAFEGTPNPGLSRILEIPGTITDPVQVRPGPRSTQASSHHQQTVLVRGTSSHQLSWLGLLRFSFSSVDEAKTPAWIAMRRMGVVRYSSGDPFPS
jgi:hypothetical protein